MITDMFDVHTAPQALASTIIPNASS